MELVLWHFGLKENYLPNRASVQIAPAEGKLGVLIPGMGAVTTTFIAGLEAFKLGLGKPIGSLTQLGTVRLGKRTEGRSPAIKDFVPLARMSDIEVACRDIFEDNAWHASKMSTRRCNRRNVGHEIPSSDVSEAQLILIRVGSET
jgi:hypothetical protein